MKSMKVVKDMKRVDLKTSRGLPFMRFMSFMVSLVLGQSQQA